MKRVLVILVAITCMQIGWGARSNGGSGAIRSSSSDGTDVSQSLRYLQDKIVEAQDAESEASAIRSLLAWVRQYQQAHTHPDSGSDLNWVLTVKEQRSGRNVTSNIAASGGPVDAEITFGRNVDGIYRTVYVMRFVPKEKSNLTLLMEE